MLEKGHVAFGFPSRVKGSADGHVNNQAHHPVNWEITFTLSVSALRGFNNLVKWDVNLPALNMSVKCTGSVYDLKTKQKTQFPGMTPFNSDLGFIEML